MIVKLAGAIMVLMSGILSGHYYVERIRFRISDLKEIQKILILMQGKIDYLETTIIEISKEFAEKDGTFKEFFVYMHDNMVSGDKRPFYDIWENAVDECLLYSHLNNEDKSWLKKMGGMLSDSRLNSQLSALSLNIDILDRKIIDLQKESSSRIKLCYSLGIALSFMIIIVLF